MSSANIRETLIGVGLVKQAAIATPNIAADFIRFNKLNGGLANVKLGTESNAGEIGNGHEFATQLFKTGWDVGGTIEKYLSVEFLSWCLAYAFGGATVSGAGPYNHTFSLMDPATAGIELPSFSYIEQIRPGGSSVIDRMAVGCVIEDFTLTISSGPTRSAAKLSVNFMGTGKLTEPSAITLPAVAVENLLPAAGLALTINGVNYVTNKNIVSLELTYKNNHRGDTGFFPGSGFQTTGNAASGAIRGRMEHGDRVLGLKFVARYENGSTEWTKLKALTAGTGVLGFTGAGGTAATITAQSLTFADVQVQDADNIVTVAVECAPLYDITNGLITATATNTLPHVGGD
jgi:hypothetical protein